MKSDASASTLFLEKLEVPRAPDILANELRRRVFSGELAEGDLLPPERTLVVQSGLGRSSVREALRTLELEDLITPKIGRYGGWVVRRPGRDSVSRSVEVFIRARKIDFTSLLETREAVEPPCASFAATNRRTEDLVELERRCAAMDELWQDPASYLEENLRWHAAVVQATHNELLIAFISALSDAIFETSEIADLNSENIRRTVVHVHRRVTDAIVEGDADTAFQRMHAHLSSFRQLATRSTGSGKAKRSGRPARGSR